MEPLDPPKLCNINNLCENQNAASVPWSATMEGIRTVSLQSVDDAAVGEALRAMARVSGVPQTDIARQLGVYQSNVSRNFRGEGLSIERTSRILAAIGMDWPDLLRELGYQISEMGAGAELHLAAGVKVLASLLGERYGLSAEDSFRDTLLKALEGVLESGDEETLRRLLDKNKSDRKKRRLLRTST